MEKNQYNLCLSVLKKLAEEKVLSHLIIVGSWCAHFYEQYFNSPDYTPSIRTRDIDFLVSPPLKLSAKVDIPSLLSGQGFTTDFMGSKGYIRLIHPDLFIEFLVPEQGKGLDKPYPLPQLGVNAQPLRFLNFLTDNLIHLI
ncbi:MAG: GSU2403 family nucleotidyltransferase fold protein [Planctomycetota bacterium]